jgi:hypothetical protein
MGSFIQEYLSQWPDEKRQCMMSTTKAPLIRCAGIAEFTVQNRHGDLKDVCRECLPVVCISHDEHDPLLVMKLLERRDSQVLHRL